MIILESIVEVVIVFFHMSDVTFITNHLHDIAGKRILVIGDIMLDEYHWGDVNRISPEAPVPVCKVSKTTLVPGGASNVALNISKLQGTPYLSGVIGQDSSAEKLLNVLSTENISTDCIHQTPFKPTTLKSRVIAHQQHIVRVDREDSNPLSSDIEASLLETIRGQADTFHAILLSDYLKGTLTDSVISQLIQLGKELKTPVIVDPKGSDYTKYTGATLLTPNYKEFCEAIRKAPTSEEEIFSEGKSLIEQFKLDYLLVTRSEKGMSIITPTEKIDIPTKAKEVFDITGAGDTVISTLTLALSAGWDLENAAYLANIAAGIVVGKVGTSTTTLSEIKEKLIEWH